MTLDEAIKHAEEVAENKEKAIKLAKGNPEHPMLSMSEKGITEYKKCINEHRQLAEWLWDYKRLKEQEPCEDAISRAELIEALNTWDKFGYAPTNELIPLRGNMDKDKYVPYIHYDDVIKCIKGMPPVTPQPEIVRCNQCKYAEVADSEDSQDGYTCQFHRGSIWFSGSYCSWAERRQDG